MWRDVRFAVRAMRKNGAFAATALLLIALGVGSATTMFSVVDTVVFRPLPFPRSEELVQVWDVARTGAPGRSVLSARSFDDLRREAQTLRHVAVYGYEVLAIQAPGGAERLIAAEVSHDFLTVLGVPPERGRDLQRAEDRPGAPRVAILSATLAARLGPDGSPGALVRLSGQPHEVVGVMPSGFAFPTPRVDVWRPLAADYAGAPRGTRRLFALARLGEGVRLDTARGELDAISARLATAYPETNRDRGLALVPLRAEIAGEAAPALRMLFAAAILLLGSVAANLAALFTARNAEREHEFAIRKALGASTPALIRYSVVEAVVLGAAGTGLALLLASWGLDLVRAYAPSLPRRTELTLDLRAFAFAAAVALAVAALAQSHVIARLGRLSPPLTARRGSSTAPGAARLRVVLLTVQTALATVLLFGSALLVVSASRLERVTPGFDPQGTFTAQLSLSPQHYPSPASSAAAVGAIVDRLSTIPGVRLAAAVTDLPFSGSRTTTGLEIEGWVPSASGEEPLAGRHAITPEYFAAMGIPVREGRAFAGSDDSRGRPVAIVNDAMARRFWPGGAMGRRILIGHPDEIAVFGRPVWREIIAVAGDVRHDDLTTPPEPEIYLPLAQSPATHVAFVARTAGDPARLAASVRTAIAEVDAREAPYDMRTMADRLRAFTAPVRFRAGLVTGFAVLGLVLAIVGTYGTVAYAFAQREREFAIRLALGASAHRLLLSLSASAVRIAVVGIAVGLGMALTLRSFIAALLFDVDAVNPGAFAMTAAVVAAATAGAWWLPARRLHRLDAASVLKQET